MEENNVQNVEEVIQNQEVVNEQQDNAERNFAALRKKTEQAEKERDEYMRKFHESEERRLDKEAREQESLDPNDLVERKELLKIQQEYRAMNAEMKLRHQYPDLEQVLSKENIDKFREQEPELAAILHKNPDFVEKATVTYKYIKKMIGTTDQFQKEKEIIASNASKPRSSVSAGKASPLGSMNDYIDNPEEHRKNVYKRAMEAASRR